MKEETLRREKKELVLQTFTVDSPIPYDLSTLIERIEADDNERVDGAKQGTTKQGDWNGKLTRFLGRLKAKVDDRRYGFLFRPPAASLGYGWLAQRIKCLLGTDEACPGIKIVDFSEVPSDVLPIVAGTFARLLYDGKRSAEPSLPGVIAWHPDCV